MGVLTDLFSINPNQIFEPAENQTPTAPADNFFESLLGGGQDSQLEIGNFPADEESLQQEVEELIDAGGELISEVLETAREATVSVLNSDELQSFIEAPSLDSIKGVLQSDEIGAAITSFTNVLQTDEFQNVIKEATDVFKSFLAING